MKPIRFTLFFLTGFSTVLAACSDNKSESSTEDSHSETSTEADPNDVDDDGDGQTENEGDCDDTDPSVYTGAEDTTIDGTDQDCDGIDADCINDDSFAETWPANDAWGGPLVPITGCEDVFNETFGWLGCHSSLRWISWAYDTETLADFCECECPDRGQEAPYCVTLTLTDSGGDGWNGGYLSFDMATYTLDSGSEASFEVCHFEIEGCTNINYVAGQNPEENAWEIRYNDYLVGDSSNFYVSNDYFKVGEGCGRMNNNCENCQSIGPDQMFCGEGNFGGMFGGCATFGDGIPECNDGRDEIPGGRYTCSPYNYIPPE